MASSLVNETVFGIEDDIAEHQFPGDPFPGPGTEPRDLFILLPWLPVVPVKPLRVIDPDAVLAVVKQLLYELQVGPVMAPAALFTEVFLGT
jgi:hypothetical protein